jgi:hypothetical protein
MSGRYSSAGLLLQVKTPSRGSAFTLEGENYIQICEQNGCREVENLRDPFLCMAHPTPSPTVPNTGTASVPATQSMAETPTDSPLDTRPATLSASPIFTRDPQIYKGFRRFCVMEYLMFSLAFF